MISKKLTLAVLIAVGSVLLPLALSEASTTYVDKATKNTWTTTKADANLSNSNVGNPSAFDSYGVYVGGYSDSASAVTSTNNTVTFTGSGSDSIAIVYGGYVENGNAIGNVITLDNMKVTGTGNTDESIIYGGRTYNGGKADNNIVNIINNSTIGTSSAYVRGGSSTGYKIEGSASGNVITITDSTVGGEVQGGSVYFKGDVNNNKVILNGATVVAGSYGRVKGGYTEDGNAKNNEVHLNGSSKAERIWGADIYSGSGVAEGNKVYINSSEGVGTSSKNGAIYGGETEGTGNAIKNEVHINNGNNNAYVYGGYSSKGKAEENIVEVNLNAPTKTSLTGDVFGGSGKEANKNQVNLKAGTVQANVTGGYASNLAQSNIVNVEVALDGFDIKGGESYEGTAQSNEVNLNSNSNITGNNNKVYGGYSQNKGTTVSNVVNIKSGAQVNVDVIGGSTVNDGTVQANVVNVYDGASVNAAVIGGYSNYGSTVKENAVFVEKPVTVKNVYGAYINTQGTAKENEVTINGTSSWAVGLEAVGAFVTRGSAENNKVYIVGSSNMQRVLVKGAAIDNGTAKNNVVNIANSATASGNIYGGYVKNSGDAVGNEINVNTTGQVAGLYGGYVENAGTAKDNKVNLNSDNTISGDVVGGYAKNVASNNIVDVKAAAKAYNGIIGGQAAEASDNKVLVKAKPDTGNSSIIGGKATVKASGNIVEITSTDMVDAAVYGGFATGTGVADGNKVSVQGAGQASQVYGAKGQGKVSNNIVEIDTTGIVIEAIGGVTDSTNAQDVSDNTINWMNGTVTNVYGGCYNGSLRGGVNNALSVYHNEDGNPKKSLGSVDGVDKINFYLGTDVQKDSVIVKATKTVNLNGVKVTLQNDPRAGKQFVNSFNEKGDIITLIDNTQGHYAPEKNVLTANFKDYDFYVKTTDDDKQLIAVSSDVKLNDETKTLPEGATAALAGLVQTAEIVMNNLDTSEKGYNIFTVGTYTKDRVNTGSHVDTYTLSGRLGVARKDPNKCGERTIGAFVEGGRGTYTTHNDYSSGSVRADGDISYLGLGLFANQEYKNGTYLEGLLRIGSAKRSFKGVLAGNDAAHNTDSTYWGGHIKFGKFFRKANSNTNFDLYGMFNYVRLGSDSTDLPNGSKLDYDAMDSKRLRAGLRYNVEPQGKVPTMYAGLAYEYEFGGKASGTLDGMALESPTMKGSTGVIEIGAKSQPTDKMDMDFRLEGRVGTRKGFGGVLKFNWKL